MSKNFKPLYAQVAEQMATELKNGTSPLQKPVMENGTPAFVKPVNPFTGNGYSVLNALNLAAKGYDDPRWMSLKEASFNKFKVTAGEKGTLITFPKRTDIEAVRNAAGEKVKNGEGVTQTRQIEYDKTQTAKSFLFNAKQMEAFPPLAEFLEKQPKPGTSPEQALEKMIADLGVNVIYDGVEAAYDRTHDIIVMPMKEQFVEEAKFNQVLLHQLIHATGHEARLNRNMDGKFGSFEYGKEELRTAIAAMVIGAETGVGHHFPHHQAYSSGWTKMLTDTPYELAKITQDAQKAVSLLLGYGQKRDEKKTAEQSTSLDKGEVIAYNNTTYEVLSKRQSVVTLRKDDTGEEFKARPADKIYANLVDARNHPQADIKQEQNEDEAAELQLQAEPEIERTNKIGR